MHYSFSPVSYFSVTSSVGVLLPEKKVPWGFGQEFRALLIESPPRWFHAPKRPLFHAGAGSNWKQRLPDADHNYSPVYDVGEAAVHCSVSQADASQGTG